LTTTTTSNKEGCPRHPKKYSEIAATRTVIAEEYIRTRGNGHDHYLKDRKQLIFDPQRRKKLSKDNLAEKYER